MAIFLGKMLSDQQVTINGDGEKQRDYVFVSDCAWADVLAMSIENSSGIYNLGSNRGTSVTDIFATLRAVIGNHQKPIFGPAKNGETRQIHLDPKKAKNELVWFPKTDLLDGIERMSEYVQISEIEN